MAWNGPINGDWSNVDWNAGPWANKVCVLTHEECVYVITECNKIIADYQPSYDHGNPYPTDAYILDKYDNLDNWEKPIQGMTYDILKQYDPEINTLGINENGIIYPEVPEVPEEGV